jgi:hypothetical protein
MNIVNVSNVNEPQYIYYNIEIEATENNKIAQFSQTRSLPLINMPSRYQVALDRLYIPTQNIPLFIWENGKYTVSLSVDGITFYVSTLVWVPNNLGSDLYGQSVYSYQYMLDRLNDSLLIAFNDLVSDIGNPIGILTPPRMTFDAKSKLFTLQCEEKYNINFPGTIKVYFNNNLYNLFEGIQVISTSIDINAIAKYQIQIKSNFNNLTDGILYITQEFPSLSNWRQIKQLRFTTNLPTTAERLSGSADAIENIIFDYNIKDDDEVQNAILYSPEAERRYYSLGSDYPIQQINFNCYWVDRRGKKYEIYIPVNNTMTAKLIFEKI